MRSSRPTSRGSQRGRFHIVWQFSDLVSGPWNMGVLQDGTWHHFKWTSAIPTIALRFSPVRCRKIDGDPGV